MKKITKKQTMFNLTIKNVLKQPTAESELLLAYAIHKDRVFVLTHSEYQIDLFQYWYFIYCLFLLKQGHSVAAIIHKKEFFGLDFYVNKNVLIPRPETELIVQEVLEYSSQTNEKILLIDIGTGSGCIPISILKNSDKINTTIALDISKKALNVAQKNIHTHNVKIKLLQSNLLSKLQNRDFKSFDKIIITANLPYLTDKQVESEISIQKEPRLALVAKENGLALYRQLLEQVAKIFTNKQLLILFEIDPTQPDKIIDLSKKYLPQSKLKIKKDLAGLDRILKIST